MQRNLKEGKSGFCFFGRKSGGHEKRLKKPQRRQRYAENLKSTKMQTRLSEGAIPLCYKNLGKQLLSFSLR